MVKGSGHTNDRETAFDNPSKMQPKRPHQWFVDGAEVEFFPNKKQAVEDANGKSSSGFSSVSISPWENNPNFPSVPNIGQLFGSETRQVNFIEKNASYVPADDRNVRSNMITNQYVDNASFGLSISHSVEDPEARRNVRGRKKVKVNRVKDSNGVRRPEGQNFNRQSNGDLHQAYGGEVEPRSASIGQAFGKDGNVTLMGLTYNRGDVTSPAADNGQLYNQSSAHVLTTGHEKELDASNSDAAASPPKAAKVKSETVSKNKQESKATKKEAPNSFPTNVRSLISTGILDGVPVKYVSVAREELRGIIKGSGYRCGCQKCNYSKALNAYEFERHAGCKSKHPNNHIYFENGKTIYQIVQELKSTPESLLFDTIQTVFGAPINQKAFRYWKESYQAATRELQRIYGKEELNV